MAKLGKKKKKEKKKIVMIMLVMIEATDVHLSSIRPTASVASAWPKLYKPSAIKTQMNIVAFCFWSDLAILVCSENSAILYLNLKGVFSCFHGQKMRNSAHCIVAAHLERLFGEVIWRAGNSFIDTDTQRTPV